MNGPQLSPIRKAWYRWKSLKLPWRKRFLVGLDLQGNTYWEFHDAITIGRMRRIVEFPPSVQYSDVKLTPQWHQWLRHTRLHPPTLTEQSQDLIRQEHLKVLAARADARWEAKESYLDRPESQQRLPVTDFKDRGRHKGEVDGVGTGVENRVVGLVDTDGGVEGQEDANRKVAKAAHTRGESRVSELKEKDDPWSKVRGGPSEEWQPQAWSGGEVAPRRR